MRAIAVVFSIALSGCLSPTSATPALAPQAPAPIPSSQFAETVALRQKYDLAIPTDAPVVFVESTRIHHTRQVFSTIATRDRAGVWTISQIGEETAGLLRIEPRLIPEKVRTLTPQEGATLDRLIGRAVPYSQQRDPSTPPGIGAAFHTMEVVGTDRRVVYQWTGRLNGRPGEIADLVIGAG